MVNCLSAGKAFQMEGWVLKREICVRWSMKTYVSMPTSVGWKLQTSIKNNIAVKICSSNCLNWALKVCVLRAFLKKCSDDDKEEGLFYCGSIYGILFSLRSAGHLHCHLFGTRLKTPKHFPQALGELWICCFAISMLLKLSAAVTGGGGVCIFSWLASVFVWMYLYYDAFLHNFVFKQITNKFNK